MALVIARTVQVEKGHGVIYLDFEPSLYTSALSGAIDLPNEVGNWTLELAGRREIDNNVKHCISKKEKENIRKTKLNDEKIRIKHPKFYSKKKKIEEEREQTLRALTIFRKESLPSWPLGANHKIDHDFRTACIKKNGIQYLMLACPEIAGEVLLALIIEDQPKQEDNFHQEKNLGLVPSEDAYPTIYLKSPFFNFLKINSKSALTSLIALVNFCTERWVCETMRRYGNKQTMMELISADGSKKTFSGWWEVYNWPQSNYSICNGNLYCALDALEHWFISQIDAGDDITDEIEKILNEGESAAFVSVLINIAKYRPTLLMESLSVLLTSPYLFYWDSIRVAQIEDNFYKWSWGECGEIISSYARDWTLAPHRRQNFVDVVVEVLLVNDDIAQYLQELLSTWVLPDDSKESLEFKMIFATLNRANYRNITDPATGKTSQSLVYPESLCIEVNAWQNDNAPITTHFSVPDWCDKRIQYGQQFTDAEAANLFEIFKMSNNGTKGDDKKSTCQFAIVGTLIALADNWLNQNSKVQQQVFEVLRTGIETVDSIKNFHDELKFITYAVMHLWITDKNNVDEWEVAVLRLLTSGDMNATEIVIGVAYTFRKQLGPTWWRLLHAGLFWAGLTLLKPRQSDGDNTKHVWKAWLERLRRFPLRGQNATQNDLDFKRIAIGQGRLDFLRQAQRYNLDGPRRRRMPEHREIGKLDNQLLRILFNWLIKGEGTGDRCLDTCLTLRIWDYNIAYMKAHQENKGNQYDLSNQYFGYDILLKLAELTVAAPAEKQCDIWKQILSLGPSAYDAVQYFIRNLFLRLEKGDNPIVFECIWRKIIEYGLESNWSDIHWSYGEYLIHDILGFRNEDSLTRLKSGAALRLKDTYKRWAINHLDRNKEGIISFCRFLITEFGTPLRLDGLCWLADTLKKNEFPNYWYPEQTGEALIMLVTKILSCDTQILPQDTRAQQALFEVTAALVTNDVPGAMSLQERIKLL